LRLQVWRIETRSLSSHMFKVEKKARCAKQAGRDELSWGQSRRFWLSDNVFSPSALRTRGL